MIPEEDDDRGGDAAPAGGLVEQADAERRADDDADLARRCDDADPHRDRWRAAIFVTSSGSMVLSKKKRLASDYKWIRSMTLCPSPPESSL